MEFFDKIGDLAKKAQEKLQDAVKGMSGKPEAGQLPATPESPKGGPAEQPEWYCTRNGKEKFGPFSFPQFKDLAHAGRLLPSDMVWKKGMRKWEQAANVPDLFSQAPPNASPPPQHSAPKPSGVSIEQTASQRQSSPTEDLLEALPYDEAEDVLEILPADEAAGPQRCEKSPKRQKVERFGASRTCSSVRYWSRPVTNVRGTASASSCVAKL